MNESRSLFVRASPLRRRRSQRIALLAICLLFFSRCPSAWPAGEPALEARFAASVPQGAREEMAQSLRAVHEAMLRGSAHAARPDAQGAMEITIEWAASQEEFERRVRMRPEHIMAAAEPGRGRIIVNGEAFRAASPAERRSTMAHEYIHLFLGLRAPGPLPRWLEEGLAMHLTGETDYDAHWRLTLANSFDALIPLGNLRHGFPDDPSARETAYRQAYSATAYYLRLEYPVTGAAGLIDRLLDGERGAETLGLLWDAGFTDRLEASWRGEMSSLWGWIAAASSATALWGVATALFIGAYLRRKRKDREILRRWQSEEEGNG